MSLVIQPVMKYTNHLKLSSWNERTSMSHRLLFGGEEGMAGLEEQRILMWSLIHVDR